MALDLRLPGYSADGIARELCKFVVFLAHDQTAHIDAEGRVRLPAVLTQSKVWVREFWAVALFRRYRRYLYPDL